MADEFTAEVYKDHAPLYTEMDAASLGWYRKGLGEGYEVAADEIADWYPALADEAYRKGYEDGGPLSPEMEFEAAAMFSTAYSEGYLDGTSDAAGDVIGFAGTQPPFAGPLQ